MLETGYGAYSKINRSFLKFQLPSLNTGDIVYDARLYSCLYSDTSNPRQINIHEITGGWNSRTLTWNNAPSYDGRVADLKQVSGGIDTNFFWDITSIAKDWYSTGQNNGVMLKNQDEGTGYTEFLSSDCD